MNDHGFEIASMLERPDVSELWRRLYAQWTAHEAALRDCLDGKTVDALMSEVAEVGPVLDDGRPWLLVTALCTRT